MTTTLTGYGVARLANVELKAAGLKEIPPQMVYRYMDQKLITTVEVEGQRLVQVSDAEAWITKYVTKRIEKAINDGEAVAEVEELENDLHEEELEHEAV
jgi:hypothetical protein